MKTKEVVNKFKEELKQMIAKAVQKSELKFELDVKDEGEYTRYNVNGSGTTDSLETAGLLIITAQNILLDDVLSHDESEQLRVMKVYGKIFEELADDFQRAIDLIDDSTERDNDLNFNLLSDMAYRQGITVEELVMKMLEEE